MKKLKEIIENELIDLNLPLQGDSFVFWTELLLYIKHKNIETFDMIKLYQQIAKRYKKTGHCVERSLRRGTLKMQNRIQEKYKINTKITNETVLRLFQIKVF